MSPTWLFILHVTGVLAVFTSLGALVGQRAGSGGDGDRKLASALHGVALLLVVGAGGALASANGHHFALWLWIKVAVWLALGAAPVVIRRAPQLARPLLIALPLLGLVALWATFTKPGV